MMKEEKRYMFECKKNGRMMRRNWKKNDREQKNIKNKELKLKTIKMKKTKKKKSFSITQDNCFM